MIHMIVVEMRQDVYMAIILFKLNMNKEILNNIPKQTQRQDSLTEQLKDLKIVAVKLGMYDAVDYLNSLDSKKN